MKGLFVWGYNLNIFIISNKQVPSMSYRIVSGVVNNYADQNNLWSIVHADQGPRNSKKVLLNNWPDNFSYCAHLFRSFDHTVSFHLGVPIVPS
jgi:hypothetical protein